MQDETQVDVSNLYLMHCSFSHGQTGHNYGSKPLIQILSNVKVQNQVIREKIVKIGIYKNLVTARIAKQDSKIIVTGSIHFSSTSAQVPIKSAEFRTSMAGVSFSCRIFGKTQNPETLQFTCLVPIIVSQHCYLSHNYLHVYIYF